MDVGAISSPSVCPTLNYQDAHEAIRWLVDVLGFRLAALFEDVDGGVAYAQLVWGAGSINLSTRDESGPMPRTGPSSTSLTAQDRDTVDRHFEQAVAAGGNIVRPVQDNFTGNHGFTVQDPEGNLWNVGIDWLQTDAAQGLPERRI